MPVISSFVKARIGSVKAPKLVEIWPDLPRSKVGKVLKKDIRAAMLDIEVKMWEANNPYLVFPVPANVRK